MTELTKENKEKLKALESDIKIAFKENRFEQVAALAANIKSIDPENHLAVRLLEKMEQAKAEDKAKKNAAKIREYENMLGKQLKDGNIENVRKLAQELRELDAKSADNWFKKAADAEAVIKQKKNAAMIEQIEKHLKTAFKENRFEEVKVLASKLKELDPKNTAGEKFLVKIEEAKAEAKASENKAKIGEIEKQLKILFKQARFEEVKALASKLKELDPRNKTGEKFLADIDKAKTETKRKENADRINAFQNEIKLAFKEARFDDLGKTANKLFEIDPGNSFAKKFLAKAVKAKEKAEKEKEKSSETVSVKGEGFFAKLFRKPKKEKEETVKKTAEPQMAQLSSAAQQPVKMAIPQKAVPSVPAKTIPFAPAETAPSVHAKTVLSAPGATPAEAKKQAVPVRTEPLKIQVIESAEPTEEERAEALNAEKGNIFTKMFGNKEDLEKPEGSIIDTIVAKTAEKKAAEVRKPKTEKNSGLAFANFARAFLQFSAAFIIISAGFFYVENIDTNNTVLSLFGIEENNAGRLHAASETLNEKQADERALNGEITRYKEGYDNEYEKIVAGIIEKRMNWPEVMIKINEIANSVYERNEISQYIKFSSFSFDAKTGQIRVSGTLSDPLGKNLTKLAELEEAFSYFPKDRNNPADPVKPYFYGVQEFKSLSKSYDARTGKYTSTFQISFLLEEPVEEQ